MTARTSQKLADALRAAGLEALAVRAEADEFHDFLSPHTFPELTLADLLTREAGPDVMKIRQRLINGDFDADLKESDDWANSPDGQDTFNKLIKGQ